MSGWEQPGSPPRGAAPGPSYWTLPDGSDPLRVGQLIRRAWRLYRSMPRLFFVVAAIPAVIQALLALPSLSIVVQIVEGMVDVFVRFFEFVAANPEAYQADPQAFQAELQAQLQAVVYPPAELGLLSALTGGIGVAVALIGTAALTATALSVAAGRPIPAAFAFRLVAARAGLLKPIVALAIGYAAVAWFPLVLQSSTDIQAWAGAPGSPRGVLIASLLSVLALVVFVGIVVFAVRWALFIPAVLVESLGVGPGLARAAELTRGIRIRLGLAMAGLILLQALIVGIVSAVVGFTVGLAVESVTAGFLAYLIAGLVGGMLWAPLMPAMFAHAYRVRTNADATSAVASEAPD